MKKKSSPALKLKKENMNKDTNDIWERLHGIAIGTGNISISLSSLEGSLDKNTDKLVQALNKNSKSADYLAKVGIFIGIVGLLATLLGLWYTFYPLFK